MPTRKQRRRRAKELRHEYVWADEEGRELEPEEVAELKGEAPRGRGRAPRTAGSRREPQPPSWRRAAKRGLVFAPIMLVTVMLLSSDLTLAQQITQTLLIVAIFVPFSYFLDGVFWRSYRKRLARREREPGQRGG
ncbi:MAG TPA: hypothetical protein VNK94_10845 [Gaiellaceae bacterium]|nr:hypothetical protein [Gaiellaceae bacterium]